MLYSCAAARFVCGSRSAGMGPLALMLRCTASNAHKHATPPQHRFKQLFGGDDVAARRGRALYELFREEVRRTDLQLQHAFVAPLGLRVSTAADHCIASVAADLLHTGNQNRVPPPQIRSSPTARSGWRRRARWRARWIWRGASAARRARGRCSASAGDSIYSGLQVPVTGLVWSSHKTLLRFSGCKCWSHPPGRGCGT